MARDDQTGELPSTRTNEWQDVQAALQRAREMAATTAQALGTLQGAAIRRQVVRPSDTRLTARPSNLQARIRVLLGTHFRLPNPGAFDVLNLVDGYRRLHRRLMRLNRQSFRMVTAQVADGVAQGGAGDTFGYVLPDDRNTIYLNETYFSLGGGTAPAGPASGGTVTRTRRSVVQAGGGGVHIQQPLPVRAGVVLHETAHLVFGANGAVHRAINAGTPNTIGSTNCSATYPQIMTLTQAMGDAYVWERFAHCVHAVATPTGQP